MTKTDRFIHDYAGIIAIFLTLGCLVVVAPDVIHMQRASQPLDIIDATWLDIAGCLSEIPCKKSP